MQKRYVDEKGSKEAGLVLLAILKYN